MDLGARIGWGVIIYAIVFLMTSGMSLYGWYGFFPSLAGLFVLLVVCVWAGLELKFRAWSDILPYSIGWALIAMALDAIFAVPSEGWGLYTQWSAWAGYALVALLPLLAIFLRRKPAAAHGPWES